MLLASKQCAPRAGNLDTTCLLCLRGYSVSLSLSQSLIALFFFRVCMSTASANKLYSVLVQDKANCIGASRHAFQLLAWNAVDSTCSGTIASEQTSFLTLIAVNNRDWSLLVASNSIHDLATCVSQPLIQLRVDVVSSHLFFCHERSGVRHAFPIHEPMHVPKCSWMLVPAAVGFFSNVLPLRDF